MARTLKVATAFSDFVREKREKIIQLNYGDPVAMYFEQQGRVLEPYYFLDSYWEIAKTIDLGAIRVSFRTQEDIVIICDLAVQDCSGLHMGLMQLVRFAKEVVALPTIRCIKGMLLGPELDPTPQNTRRRERMAAFLLEQGAQTVVEDGKLHLIFHRPGV